MNEQNNREVCCLEFHPEKWEAKTHQWDNKLFIKETMPTFFHMPLASMINKKVTKMCQMMEEAKMAESNSEDVLLLFRDPSAFKSEIYLSVAGEIPKANNVGVSGLFFSKVFAGPYKDVPKFIKQMDDHLAKENKKAKDYYIHYAYCPKCAEKYGKNYMIIFAQIN